MYSYICLAVTIALQLVEDNKLIASRHSAFTIPLFSADQSGLNMSTCKFLTEIQILCTLLRCYETKPRKDVRIP